MIWTLFKKNKVVRFLASLKLAVCVMITMIALMIWGTLTESHYNTQFAKWRVYGSPWFLITLSVLFTNILFAALVRFPFKKRLAGFYVIHLGLLTLLIGSLVTMVYGLDGSIRLLPEQSTNAVVINDPQFYVFYAPSSTREPLEFVKPMPKTTRVLKRSDSKPFAQVLDYDIYLKEYIPFATGSVSYKPHSDPQKKSLVVGGTLANAQFKQDLELSDLIQEGHQKQLGPLKLELFSRVTSNCMQQALQNQDIEFVSFIDDHCVALPKSSKSKFTIAGFFVEKSQSQSFDRITITTKEQKTHTFFPKLSKHPVNENIQINPLSPVALIDLKPYREGPHVFFFHDLNTVYGKGSQWSRGVLELNKGITLPWMGFTLTIDRLIQDQFAHTNWEYTPPKGSESQRYAAAHIVVQNRYQKDDKLDLWIDDSKLTPAQTKAGLNLNLMIGNKVEYLPFSLELERFQMNTNPGTMDPASYESFVTLREKNQTENVHVYMNNPLKKDRYTFYQASYFELPKGGFGSVLSVNHDPGRSTKYAGSLLLVFGSIWHFGLRKKRKSS